ncbi:MAG: ceramidase domain-containing protein [Planctomycetota bacterium]|jgi:hypothetical protein
MYRHDPIPFWIHAFAWGGVLAIVLPLAWMSDRTQGQNVWQGWIESQEFRKPNYTEAIRAADLFRTQANTWSNLAYVLVGLYCIGLGATDLRSTSRTRRNYVLDTPAMTILMGIACCYLGIGSGLFHASLTRWGQQLDVGAMYTPLLVCIAINLGRYFPRMWRVSSDLTFPVWPVLVTCVVIVAALLYYYKWSMPASQVLPVHILMVIAFAVADCIPYPRGIQHSTLRKRWLLISLSCLALAITFRQLDVAGRFGTPDSLVQGHALWHLLTAASLGAMYVYYRSESVVER